MNIREALRKGTAVLKSADIRTPTLEAGVILCHVIQCDRTYIYTHDDIELKPSQREVYLSLLAKRIKGLPLQHITGYQEFMSLPFKVNKDVLIPRQDTETLVETVIERVKNLKNQNRNNIRIMDMGTGSGCIAVSLAHYIENAFITAVDISEKALDIARLNAKANNAGDRIAFVHSNIFRDIPDEYCGRVYDAIVSNPPYIPTDDIQHLQKEVKYFDPIAALDGGSDGLSVYRTIVEAAPDFIVPRGLLAFEVGIGQADAVAELMSEKYEDIEIVKDLSGIDRVVAGLKMY